MRGVAALVVHLNHAYAQVYYPAFNDASPGMLSIARYSMVAGHLAVTVFIVISGFCLTCLSWLPGIGYGVEPWDSSNGEHVDPSRLLRLGGSCARPHSTIIGNLTGTLLGCADRRYANCDRQPRSAAARRLDLED